MKLFLNIFWLFPCFAVHARQAVVIVPLTDGLIHSAGVNNGDVQHTYAELSYLSKRAGQFLFNTIVDVIDTTDDEAQIRVHNLFYDIDQETHQPLCTFWIQNKSIHYLDELSEACRIAIPESLSYEKDYWGNEHTLVVTLPWHSIATNTYYSVGTRFVRFPTFDTDTAYAIIIYDANTQTALIDSIDCQHACIECSIPLSKRRKAFVNILSSWIAHAQEHDTQIPYVWGGASFLGVPTYDTCLAGFDCSSLILRAAQIVSIPLATKTSGTMERILQLLMPNDMLQPGDIIWIPGHVMIVANLERNELIHAIGYNSGYGCLCCHQLKQVFKGIETYAQLVACCHAQTPISILSKNGSVLQHESAIKILKLPMVPII